MGKPLIRKRREVLKNPSQVGLTAFLLSGGGHSYHQWEQECGLQPISHCWFEPDKTVTPMNCTQVACPLHLRLVNKKSEITPQFLKWFGKSFLPFLLSSAKHSQANGKWNKVVCWSWVRLITYGVFRNLHDLGIWKHVSPFSASQQAFLNGMHHSHEGSALGSGSCGKGEVRGPWGTILSQSGQVQLRSDNKWP